MEDSSVQSMPMMSSVSSSKQAVDSDQGGASSSNSQHESPNQGLTLWNQTRQKWVENKKTQTRSNNSREPTISWNATYESLLGTSKPFYKPIPLFEMIDFLVDIWEEEGLYDC